MTSRFMEKLKETLGTGSSDRPQIPLARPEVTPPEAREIQSGPRVQFKGSASPSARRTSSTSTGTGAHDVLDAAHSPPSVLSQHLGPPTIEHKYPQDSKWRRHSISAQEQHYMR